MFSKTVCVDGRFLYSLKVGVDNFGGRRWRGIRRQAVGRQSTVQSVDNDMEVATSGERAGRGRAGSGSGSGVTTTARRNFAGTRRPSEVAARYWSTVLDDVIFGQPPGPTRPSVVSPHRPPTISGCRSGNT